MAITDPTVKTALLPCDPATLEYAFNFKILSKEELSVFYYAADGSSVELTYGADYIVIPRYASLESGGEIELTFTPATGYSILMVRNTDRTQLYDPVAGGGLSAGSIENALDRAIMILQEEDERIGRSLVQDPSATTEMILPSATELANHFLAFDALGDPIAADPTSVPVTAFMQTLLDDEDAATARTTLELGTASIVDHGTAAGEVPLNSDLGTASLIDITVSTSDPSGGNDGDIWFKV